jgi:hypothetical protein
LQAECSESRVPGLLINEQNQPSWRKTFYIVPFADAAATK